jgi:molybdenum cofactor cytidylyltransferase
MIYGKFPIGQAAGLLLTHTVHLDSQTFSKGCCLSVKDVAVLRANGISEVNGAQLEANDVEGKFAAIQIAEALIGAHITIRHSCYGCYNLRAETAGVLVIARDDVDRINLCSSQVAVATLPPWSVVRQGDFIATVSIIPFAVQRQTVEKCCAAADGASVVTVAPFLPHRVALIISTSPGTPKRLLDETDEVTRGRVESLGSQMILCQRQL